MGIEKSTTGKPTQWNRSRLLYLAFGILICSVGVVLMVLPH